LQSLCTTKDYVHTARSMCDVLKIISETTLGSLATSIL